MKILLQHKRTLQYVQTVDSWTKKDSEAHNFYHSQSAIDFAREHDLTDVCVTVKFLGGDPDVWIPMPDKVHLPPSRARL